MAPRNRTLGVWLDGLRIADLEQRRRPEIRCRYTELALDTWQLNSPLISCSLPLSTRPQDARAFCVGLLPEGQARFPGLVAAEAQCLLLARTLGLTTIESELVGLGDTDCLIVSRFDRQDSGSGTVRRIHQEDLCQAAGVDPDQQGGRGKYERAGGPGLRDIARLLDTWAVDSRAELDTLVRAVTYTVLIGNADAHGKNLALLHPTPQTVTLAPLYDTVPTVLWPRLRSEAAMAVGGQRMLPAVTLDDIVAEARRWSHPADRARDVATTTVIAAVTALADGVITADTPLADTIRARAKELLIG